MNAASFVTARDRVLRVIDTGAEMTDVLDACLAALHDVARFRWAALMTVDPTTVLPAAGVVEGFSPDACGPFWDMELVGPGYNKFSELARSRDPVATLFEATEGDLGRSPAYNELYAGLGASDELRAAFVLGSTCWGIVSLVRAEPDGPFADQEVEAVRHLDRFIARAMREAMLRDQARRETRTAVLMVDASNQVVHATVEARTLLETLRGVHHIGWVAEPGTDDRSQLPGTLLGLVSRARSSCAGDQATTRIRSGSGAWMRVSAARTASSDGHVALVIEPARTRDLVPIVLEGFGLSEREIEIVGQLARGLSSRDIAAELSLSPHTVRDHVKAILRKCGASTRGELVARLFADHVRPAFEKSVHQIS